MEDGIYKSNQATYFVYDGKVIMRMNGEFYKTNKNFMVGASYDKELTNGMKQIFEKTYSQLKSW